MSDKTILFISGNRHKYMEIEPIASRHGYSLELYPGHKLEIQADDLELIAENAALNAYRYLRKPLLVEDAGLFIKVLGGFPGPYSNYVYRKLGTRGILKLMQGAGNRDAYFESAAVIIYKPCFISVKARTNGVITMAERGSGGFGFDPIFQPEDSRKTFAEMSIAEKNKYSHRAKSVEATLSKLAQCLRRAGNL